jgi:hypothetical protein
MMKGYHWQVITGVIVALIGVLMLTGGGRKAGPSSPSWPPCHIWPPTPTPVPTGPQVTMTAAGMWVTYTKDGEGNPLYP